LNETPRPATVSNLKTRPIPQARAGLSKRIHDLPDVAGALDEGRRDVCRLDHRAQGEPVPDVAARPVAVVAARGDEDQDRHLSGVVDPG